MTNAKAIGETILRIIEGEPRTEAIDALAMVLCLYVHDNDIEFFSSRIVEASRDHPSQGVH